MMKKGDFDQIIKDNLDTCHDACDFGYTVPSTGRTYAHYFSRQAFADFVEELKTPSYLDIFHAYNAGKRSELDERSGRYGNLPPKMASVASSSRFCYLALRDGAEALGGSGCVEFEHECRIAGISGTAPQLDAYIPAANIYIEAKCHEIFDAHRVVLKQKYWERIYGQGNSFGFLTETKPAAGEFEVPLSAFGIRKASSMFDIKQLLCHLLGIASRPTGPATLVYLFFKPQSSQPDIQAEINKVFDALQDEIAEIFQSAPIQHFCRNHHIRLWAAAEFSPVMEHLNSGNMITIAKTS